LRGALSRLGTSPLVAVSLAAVYPVAFLWAHNVGKGVALADVAVVVAAVVGGSLVVYAVARAIVHDAIRAGLITLWCQLIVLSFGHALNASSIAPGGSRETVFFLAWVLALGAGSVLIAAKPRGDTTFRLVTPVLVALVALDVVQIVGGGEVTAPTIVPTAAVDFPAAGMDPGAAGPARDVYYLIFDRYGGERTLQDLYGFDDRPFLEGLRSRGFTVLDDPLANYPQTTHSLASSLNMVYLDDLAERVGADSSDWAPLYASLSNTSSSRLFQRLGYRYVHLGSWWGPTAIDPSADLNLTYDIVHEFPETFIGTTIIPALLQRLPVGYDDFFERQYSRVAYQVSSIEQIARDPRPTYTFAHFTMPHPPYVFNADGTYRPQDDPAPIEQKYVDQLRATNDLIDGLIDSLLAGPEGEDPILVLQSDEGPYPPELDTGIEVHFNWAEANDVELGRRFRILDAIFLPGRSAEDVPAGLTPVNTFRLIFDDYFGATLPMLPDRVDIFTDHDHPFTFRDVTDRLAPP